MEDVNDNPIALEVLVSDSRRYVATSTTPHWEYCTIYTLVFTRGVIRYPLRMVELSWGQHVVDGKPDGS